MNERIITLTTDFGTADPFVGILKGVILGIYSQAQVVDITHQITPYDILQGALTIHAAYRYFPDGTIHVVVVDPMVGSPRRVLMIRAAGQTFIGPDNGIFTLIIRDHPDATVIEVTADHYFLKGAGGRTFQGRDVFAPVAAWFARGVAWSNFGEEISDYQRIDIPQSVLTAEGIQGEIIHIDRFGNLITNITGDQIRAFLHEKDMGADGCLLQIQDLRIQGLRSYYAETGIGEPAFLINSFDRLEIYSNSGRASELLKAGMGERVMLRICSSNNLNS
jgi:hypothetical protein